MRLRRGPVAVLVPVTMLVVAVLGGCARDGGTVSPPGTTASVGGAPPPTSVPPPPPASEPASPDVEYRVSYGWAVPSSKVTIPHAVSPPIAPPPSPPLPYLVAIYVGNHPEASPQYQRISFYFRGGFPEYNLQYVSSVTSEGRGETVPLQGNGFLRIGFVSAQAHDNAGESTVRESPKNPIGFANLKSYGFAGDFEGHVTYGLGIQSAPNSDQVLPIRAGELKKPDGAGGFFYVVHFDVQAG
jgi:hypothetical protein